MSESSTRVRLTVIQAHEETRWEPDGTVPATTADCPDTSQVFCPHYRCRLHLARVDACDRAGRPSLAALPRDSRGWTVRRLGQLGDARSTTLEPMFWMNEDGSQKTKTFSCALQVVKQLGKLTNEQAGAVLLRHRTLIARELKSALRSAIENGERLGLSPEDLKVTLIALGEEAVEK